MHKVILVYGPENQYQLNAVLGRHVGESVRASRLLDVLELHGMPVSTGPWSLVFDSIRMMIGEYNSTPSFAVVHEGQLKEGWYDGVTGEFDAVFSYAYDPETGYRLAKLYRPWVDYTGDWWAVGGRWVGLLIPKSESVEDVPMEYPNTRALEYFISRGGEKVDPSEIPPMNEPMARNVLRFGDIDWEKMAEQMYNRIPVDDVIRVSETYGFKSPELLFEEIYGNDMRALPAAQQAYFRVNKRYELWQLFWKQFDQLENLSKEDKAIAAGWYSFLGQTRERLERYNAIAVYLHGGVIFQSVYCDGLPDLTTADPISMDRLIELGETLRDLPPETVVTVVDLHY